MAENKIAKKQIDVGSISIANPEGMLALATTVQTFIREQKLFQIVQGKEYVNVEGWQFAGAMLGVMPIVVDTINESTDVELKYKAIVELINIHSGQKVGAGRATCSSKENGKKYYQEYAIESMAQTRATGKAFRIMLGWLMKAAGYEATPAEEMDFQAAQVVEEKQPETPVMQVQIELADKSIRDSMLLNLEGFKGLYAAKDLTKLKATFEALPADKAEDTKKGFQDGILKRLVAKRPELNHSCTVDQLNLIDKMLLSSKFNSEEKAAFNSASYEYDNIDASNRIDWLITQMKARNTKAAA